MNPDPRFFHFFKPNIYNKKVAIFCDEYAKEFENFIIFDRNINIETSDSAGGFLPVCKLT